MTYVDEAKSKFDALRFCEVITAIACDKPSSGSTVRARLRNGEATTAATDALELFSKLAVDSETSDVVSAFLQMSPTASELFATLSLVSLEPMVALGGLNCLIGIARYADPKKPATPSVVAARAIVKDIVKARATTIYNVFTTAYRKCKRKAIVLLQIVATSHPLLAKELINRFDLTSPHFAPTLCTQDNHLCRIPFLNLVSTLFATDDFDVIKYFSSKGRTVVLACVNVISSRVKRELQHGKSVTSATGSAQQPRKKVEIMPSYVQQREIDTAVAFLTAFRRSFADHSAASIRRAVFTLPVLQLLATIAAAPMPPLAVAPRQVTSHHEKLRNVAKDFFTAIAGDRAIPAHYVTAALVAHGDIPSTTLAMRVICAHPRVCEPLLRGGSFVAATPHLSSAWLANAAVLAAALLRTPRPPVFPRNIYVLNAAISHSNPLVRYIGATLALAVARLVEKESDALSSPLTFLPAPKDIRHYVHDTDHNNFVARRLLSTYQRIFDVQDEDDANRDLIHASLVASRHDYLVSEDAIRGRLSLSPRETVSHFTRRHYLSELINQAANSVDNADRSRLWNLSAHIIKQADLFPQGTHHDVDIILAVLSSIRGDDFKSCVEVFEDIIGNAIGMPFGLFDAIHAVNSPEPNPHPRASLLTAACFLRLRKLIEKNVTVEKGGSVVPQHFLKYALLALVACEEVVSGHASISSYLVRVLPTALDEKDLWWSTSRNTASESTPTRPEACTFVLKIFNDSVTFPSTPFLNSTRFIATHRLALRADGNSVPDFDSHFIGPNLGLAWHALEVMKKSQSPDDLQADAGIMLFNGRAKEQLFEWNDSSGFLLETIGICPPSADAFTDLKRLQQNLSCDHFTLLVCLILRHGGNTKARSVAFHSLMNALRNKDTMHAEHKAVIQFRRDSLVFAVQYSSVLKKSEIEELLIFACVALSDLPESPGKDAELSFCLKILHILVCHSDHAICVHARMCLLSKSLDNFPSLLSLSFEDARYVSSVIPHFPSLQSVIVEELHVWDNAKLSMVAPFILHVCNVALDGSQSIYTTGNKIIDKKGLCTKLLYSAQPFSNFLHDDSITNAIWRIGSYSSHDSQSLLFLVKAIDGAPEDFTDRSMPIFLWMYFSQICEKQENDRLSFPSNDNLFQTVAHLALFFAKAKAMLRKENELTRLALIIFCGLLRRIKGMGYSTRVHGNSFNRVLGKPLNWAFNALSLAVSGIIYHDNKAFNDPAKKTFTTETQYFDLMFQCLSLLISFEVTNRAELEFALTHVSLNDWHFLLRRIWTELENEAKTAQQDFVIIISEFLMTVVSRLENHCVTKPVAKSLHKVHQFLSEIAPFQATNSKRDLSLWRCVRALDKFMWQSGALAQFSLPTVGKGLFNSNAAVVLAMFDKPMLESARENIYHGEDLESGRASMRWLKKSDHSKPIEKRGTNTEFVLRTFFAACMEAQRVPETAVVDIGKVAKDGVLSVALTALSAPSKNVRGLGYACIQIFAALVGPVEGVVAKCAAGLYRDRKQLAFLLKVLRNSLVEPMTEVLPLFIAWFIACLKIVLHPTNDAYKIVTKLFLREPILDVKDCVGVYHLFNCKGLGSEIKACRLVALEALQWGVRSARDALILRRRKVLDSVFMLAGSASGLDAMIRQTALSVLKAIVQRNGTIGLTTELCLVHGIIGWVAADPVVTRVTHVESLHKLALLLHVVQSCATEGAENLLQTAPDAFSALARQALRVTKDGRERQQTLVSIARCGLAVAAAFPCHLALFNVDFGSLYARPIDVPSEVVRKDIVQLMVRQRDTPVEDAVLHMVLKLRIEEVDVNGIGLQCDIDWEHTLLLDAFVARVLLARLRNRRNSTQAVTIETCNLVAHALQHAPSVWSAVAALATLTLLGRITEDIEEAAALVPADPPRIVSVEVATRFDSVVCKMRPLLVKELLFSEDK